tara:strand:+ start:330 stop:1436 length:1107 start_codon:yes stop_codon:yes gene_type:complete
MSTQNDAGWIDWVINGEANDYSGRIRYNKTNGFKYIATAGSHTFTIPDNNNIISFFTNRVELYKELFMQDNQINFRPNNDRNHTIAFSDSNMDGLLFRGWGGGGKTAFRFIASENTNTVMDLYYNKINMYKNVFLTNGNLNIGNTNTQNTRIYLNCINGNSNSNARIEFHRSGNLACRIGYEPGYQKFELKNLTGKIEYYTTTDHDFQGPGGKLVFQADRNLVIYDNGDVVKFSAHDSKNAHSSRDYKKNINDLVESESIDIIKNINPVSFKYLEKYWDKHDSCNSCNCDVRKGFIWEDTKPILPQACKTINMNNPEQETTYTLDVREVIPDLTKTVQYLINKVETLEQQLLTQSTLISNLQSQINSN